MALLNQLSRYVRDIPSHTLDGNYLPRSQEILPRLKSEVLAGCHLAFSGVISLEQSAETSEIWYLASSFGATCHTSVVPELTHLIAAKVSLFWGSFCTYIFQSLFPCS